MARLPVPGSDHNKWGHLLNDFLRVEHSDDGALKLRGSFGQTNGLATLDGTGKIPAAQLGIIPQTNLDSATRSALDRANLARLRGEEYLSVTDAPFNAAGDGATDDTNAIKSAFDAANDAGKPLFFPPGRYVCNWLYKAYVPRVWAWPGTVTILAANTNDSTWNFGATSYGSAVALNETFVQGSQQLSVASTAGLAADDLIVVRDNTADNGVAQAQTLRIHSIDSATQLTTAEPANATFTPAAGAAMQPLPKNQQGGFVSGITFRSIAPNTATAGFVRLWYCRDIDIDIVGESATNPGITLEGCYQFRIRAIARRYADQSVSGLPQFGYGVNVSGASAHGDVHVLADQVRHAVSVNGRPYSIRISGIAHGTTSTAWDAHTGGTNIVFDGCQAVGCQGFGFALRGKRQYIHGGLVDNCYGGVFVFDSPGENEIKQLKITRTRDTGSGDGNKGNGILVSNPSEGLVIQGNEISNCTRNGISFRAVGANRDVVIADNIIRNVGQGTFSNDRCGIQQLSSATFAGARISRNIFEDTQGSPTTQYGIQLTTAGTDVTITGNEFYQGLTPFNGNGIQGAAKIGPNFKTNAMAHNRLSLAFSSTAVFDASLAGTLHMTLTGNVTGSSITNPTDGQLLTLVLTQDATGGRTFSWPPNIAWPGTTPTVDATPGRSSAYSLVYIHSIGTWVALGSSGNAGTVTGVGPLDARPDAGSVAAGSRFFATDIGTESISDGNTWHDTAGATTTAIGLFADRPVANGGNAGTRYFATDSGREYYSDGSTWHVIGPHESVLFGGHTLTAGEAIMQRTQATGSVTLSNTLLRFTYFTAQLTEPVNQLRFFVTTAATGTPATGRIGIYEVDGSGNLTLLVALANDTSLFTSTGAITRSLPGTFGKVRGQRYAVGFLSSTTGTQPALTGVNLNSAAEAGITPRIAGSIGASDLANSYTAASVNNAAQIIQLHLLP